MNKVKNLNRCSFVHVKRLGNSKAHALPRLTKELNGTKDMDWFIACCKRSIECFMA